MLKILTICLLLFSACTSKPKRVYFHVSDLILTTSVDHEKQSISPCEILLPYQEKTKDILRTYYKLDEKDELLYRSAKKVAFFKDRTEIILFNINNEESLNKSQLDCHIIYKYYNESLGFSKN